MIQAQQELLAALAQALEDTVPGHGTAPAFESPKQASHGDLAITAAMPLARAAKVNPRDLAQRLVAALQAQPAVQRWVAALEIAGPGFINLRLAPAARQAVVSEVLAAGNCFGMQSSNGQHVLVEFVSANPTGPLHLGHARQAALGDALCSLFATQGWQVTREFYYNDAGVQIANLAASVRRASTASKPWRCGWPEAAYNGDYIADIAADFLAGKTVTADDRQFTASADPADLDGISQFAVAYLRHEQDLDLQAFGLKFDNYFLESSLYRDGKVEAAPSSAAGRGQDLRGRRRAVAAQHRLRRRQGPRDAQVRRLVHLLRAATWPITSTSGSAATPRCINCQGTDHHGTIARVRAGLQAAGLGIPEGFPDYVLNKMVTVMKGGAEVKISKRAGSYVTLRDLIDWTSRDAVRFFLISRKADTEFTFDVDLALKPRTTRTRCSTCSTRTRASARCWQPGASAAATPPPHWRRPTCRG
jgi:arginyl-tRNA synthetase